MSKSFGVLGAAAVVLLVGCGDETKPHPGYADPCTTAMAGALGCPARVAAPVDRPLTVDEACRKLVSCGILAGRYLRDSGTGCSTSKECTATGAECLANSSGNLRCHNPALDFTWCVVKLSLPRGATDPCDQNIAFSVEHVEATLACIGASPCSSLGASFADKLLQSSQRPAIDKYLCENNPKLVRWTATTCDFGLLYYDGQTLP